MFGVDVRGKCSVLSLWCVWDSDIVLLLVGFFVVVLELKNLCGGVWEKK